MISCVIISLSAFAESFIRCLIRFPYLRLLVTITEYFKQITENVLSILGVKIKVACFSIEIGWSKPVLGSARLSLLKQLLQRFLRQTRFINGTLSPNCTGHRCRCSSTREIGSSIFGQSDVTFDWESRHTPRRSREVLWNSLNSSPPGAAYMRQ